MDENEGGKALEGLIFISIPENFARTIGNFRMDPSILLPVETGGDPANFDRSSLGWEMILAGMLRVIRAEPESERSKYYRSFVLAVKPEIAAELAETGVLKAKNRDFDSAEEIFLALRGLEPESPLPRLDLALLYEDRADAYARIGKEELASEFEEKAFEVYKAAIQAEPPHPDTIFNAAYFFLKRRNYPRAKDLFSTYAKIGEDKKKRQQAREIAEKLESQGYLDSLFKEAYDFISMGNEEEGAKKILEFLKSYPEVWNAWFLLGWAYRRLSRWTAGRDAFLKAIALKPDEVDTLNELSICLLELGEFRACGKRLEEALRLEPDNVKIISNLGILSMKMGKKEEADGFFRAALEIEPEDPLAKKYLSLC